MIKSNHSKCCYCGGCVAVCPVSALELEETKIVIKDNCTLCKICIKFCPVNALEDK